MLRFRLMRDESKPVAGDLRVAGFFMRENTNIRSQRFVNSSSWRTFVEQDALLVGFTLLD